MPYWTYVSEAYLSGAVTHVDVHEYCANETNVSFRCPDATMWKALNYINLAVCFYALVGHELAPGHVRMWKAPIHISASIVRESKTGFGCSGMLSQIRKAPSSLGFATEPIDNSYRGWQLDRISKIIVERFLVGCCKTPH